VIAVLRNDATKSRSQKEEKGFVAMTNRPHRRYNPLRDEWVIVSPQRNERPWQGQVDRAPAAASVAYDPSCYLCPGNARAHGARNPQYTSTFAFDNDFPALRPTSNPPSLAPSVRELRRASQQPAPSNEPPAPGNQPPATSPQAPATSQVLVADAERGLCRVLCFSPRHDLTLAQMDLAAIRALVEAWIDECAAMAVHPWVKYALVFENRGEMMGASNPHPHGQIWATEHVPNEPAREQLAFARHRASRGSCLLCEYVAREVELRERIVCENDSFIVVVPFWAVWPFETLAISRRHLPSLEALDARDRDGLAGILQQLTRRYDALFDAPFPYSMGFHQSPLNDDDAKGGWHLHAHFCPPLLRSATIRKFMVGFELLGSPQRDLTPEQAAARLQEVAP
jgi:UDPglucose--hexose-1-phosphate uridylyltransferase